MQNEQVRIALDGSISIVPMYLVSNKGNSQAYENWRSLENGNRFNAKKRTIIYRRALALQKNGMLKMFTFTLPKGRYDVNELYVYNEDVYYTAALGRLIQHFKRKYNWNDYIWVAERQVRGAIHFHMLTTAYIPIKEVNDYWCNMIYDYHIPSNNAVDVTKFNNDAKMDSEIVAKYLAKYCGKGSETKSGGFLYCRYFGSSSSLVGMEKTIPVKQNTEQVQDYVNVWNIKEIQIIDKLPKASYIRAK
jgi:hypothetical protein